MLKREWGAESNGKLLHLFIPSKTATLVPEVMVEDLPWAELPEFAVKDLPRAEHSDNDETKTTYMNINEELENSVIFSSIFLIHSLCFKCLCITPLAQICPTTKHRFVVVNN